MTARGQLERSQLYTRAWEVFGADAQLRMLAEECSELAVATLHVLRGRRGNLVEELADVSILIDQVMCEMDLSEDVERMRNAKLDRLEERLRRREEARDRELRRADG